MSIQRIFYISLALLIVSSIIIWHTSVEVVIISGIIIFGFIIFYKAGSKLAYEALKKQELEEESDVRPEETQTKKYNKYAYEAMLKGERLPGYEHVDKEEYLNMFKENYWKDKYGNLSVEDIVLSDVVEDCWDIRQEILVKVFNYNEEDAYALCEAAEKAKKEAKRAKLGPEMRKIYQKAREAYVNIPEDEKNRHIPEEVKEYVWRRDDGKCVKCGSQEKLEFDHIIPFSKGGSNTARNVQLLCEYCNRSKRDTI
jgi:hypothetical protein